MAEIKDKVVTVEALAAVHTHNQGAYMAKSNPTGNGTLSMTGDGNFTGTVEANSITMGNAVVGYDTTENALKISFIANA